MFVTSTTHRRAPHARRAARQAVASGVVCAHRASRCTLTKTNCHSKTTNRFHHRNQQYSVIALTDGTGAIAERYAYSAYGEPVFVSSSGTVLSNSAKDNRYTYTGREWDEDFSLHHFRARIYDAESGRFCSRDPLSYIDGLSLKRNYFLLSNMDPHGTMGSGKGFPTQKAIELCNEGHLNLAEHEVEQLLGNVAWACVKKFQENLKNGKTQDEALAELQKCLASLVGTGKGSVFKPLIHRFGIEKTVKWFCCTVSASIIKAGYPGITTNYFDPCDEVSKGNCKTDVLACHECCDYRQCEWILTAILKAKAMTPMGLRKLRDDCYIDCNDTIKAFKILK
jgi:RHS repeat-associated protein